MSKTIEAKAIETTIVPASDEPRSLAVMTPMDMVNKAVASGASMEVLEKLMALQERWEAGQARKAFVEAFAAFKAEAITIVRNKKVTDGPLKGKSYAELFSFVDVVTPKLSEHGLSASWHLSRDEKDWIEVTCTIEHVLGHSKCVSMGGQPDVGGAKNAIQARASTVTYLERHTLKAACGVAEQGDDIDGKAGDDEYISEEQAASLTKLIVDTGGNVEKFCKFAKVETLGNIFANRYEAAVAAVNNAAAARKAKP